MTTTNPTPSQVLAALQKHGVDVQTYSGWDRVGRPWRGPDGSPGLMGAVVHHTANPNARPGNMRGILYWCTNAYDKPVCNLLIGKGSGETYLLAGGSVYHCGKGGPVPELGIPQHGFFGQTRLFGIEIDDAGTSTSSLTDYQIEQTGKVLAALTELCGWDPGEAVLTHKCYTDGCHTSAKSPLPSVGRKNDTLDGAWRQFPGDEDAKPYNAPFWRDQAVRWLEPEAWDGTVPSRRSVLKGEREGIANRAVWRLACRLHDLGFGEEPARKGVQMFPADAVGAFRQSRGWRGNGYSRRTEKAIFGTNKP